MRVSRILGFVLPVALGVTVLSGQTPAKQAPAKQAPAKAAAPSKPLEIYIVDVEGGKSDLWVTPAGQTLLIDTGSPGARDVGRIKEVMAAAGVTKLDYLVSTHYHVDHVGGLQELVTTVPVGTFVDHGPTVEGGVELGQQREQVANFQTSYAELYNKAKHMVVKVGDKIPLTGLDWTIVTSAGKTAAKTATAKANPACADEQRTAVTRDPENAQSVGSLITFGQFRALDLGDLTQDVAYDLACPSNPVGTIDLFFASNHGLIGGGNNAALIHAIQPRVATVQNSAGKGASVDMFKAFETSPGFEDAWLLHWGNAAGVEHNPAGVFIANGIDAAAIATALTAPPRGGGPGGPGGPGGGGGRGQGGPPPPAAPAAPASAGQPAAPPQAQAPPAGQTPPAGAPGGAPGGGGRGGGGGFGGGAAAHTPAYWIKISVMPNGDFTVTNTRNDFSKTYVKRAR